MSNITISSQTPGDYKLNSSNSFITITTTGGLLGATADAAALYIIGTSDTVINAGTISDPASGTHAGIQIQGAGALILNTGTIKSVYGIATKSGATGAAAIQNSGLISGTIYGIYFEQTITGAVTNLSHGVIAGEKSGIFASSAQFELSNAGTITEAAKGAYYGITSTDGSIVNQAGGVIHGAGGGIQFLKTSTVQNAGAIIGDTGYGVFLTGTGTVTNAGTIGGTSGAIEFYGTAGSDRLIVAPGAVFSGNVIAKATKDTLELASSASAGTLSGIGASFTGFQTLAFDAGAAWTLSGTAAGFNHETIDNFTNIDRLDFTGILLTTETCVNGTLAVFSGLTREATLTLATQPALTTTNFALIPDLHGGTLLTTDVTCFAAGTRILTPTGETPVEDLKTGDLVITAGAKIRPIIWAGREHVDIANHPEPELVRPIRITAGALGAGIPERDLRLSPHHAVLVNGELVEAISLVNQTTIRQEDVREVTYHHFELPDHDILFAEGAPCESYLDTGTRLQAA